jgi:hypothetical protein
MPDRCKAIETSAASGDVDRSVTTWGMTLRSKSTTTGQPPMMGKLLVTAYRQVKSAHRNPRISSTNGERHRGQMSSGTRLSSDARTITTPLRSNVGLLGTVPRFTGRRRACAQLGAATLIRPHALGSFLSPFRTGTVQL